MTSPTAFTNGNRVQVGGKLEDASVTREEIEAREKFASAATANARQKPALIMSGAINVQNDQEGRKAVRFTAST